MKLAFDEIRPYREPDEIAEAIQRILDDETFYGFAEQMFAGDTLQKMRSKLKEIKTVKEFQQEIIAKLVKKLIDETSQGFTITGLEDLDKNKSYLFISNHRDIIMDSALLCYGLLLNGMDTVEIAIGSNLLLREWITDLVKLNKSFVVKRGDVGVREQLKNAKELSAYILDAITNRNENVWIAQREGRTKDGLDQTQRSLLKMLNLAKEKDTREHFKKLNIVPLSISYEYEPCDGLKTNELFHKSSKGEYKKTEKDDMMSMFIGLQQPKGHIHFSVGKPIDDEMIDSLEASSDAEFIEQLGGLIDEHIITNYHLFPDNYIALDMLNNTTEYAKFYTEEEKELFLKHMGKKLEKVGGTTELHKELFLKIYANPILNKQNYKL